MLKWIEKKINIRLLKLSVFILILINIPVKIQNQQISMSSSKYFISVLTNQNCYTNDKIESITGKKRSLISHKFIKAWKLGNLSFIYNKSCELAFYYQNFLKQSVVRPWYGDKKILNEEISLQLAKNDEMMTNQTAANNQESFQFNSNKNDVTQEIAKNQKLNPNLKLKSKIDIQVSHEFLDIAERMKFSNRCEQKFVSKNGFGPLGKAVKETLSHGFVKDIIKYDTSFGGACPGYRKMNSEQRKNLWVFIMMSMSHYESSCKENATNQGPNGLAIGLLQLHEQNENIYTKWDPDLNCDKGASQSGKTSIRCALTMIGEQIYKGVPFFNDNSHWQVLRKVDKPGSQAYHIRYAISQILACQANPLFFDLDFKTEIKRKIEVHHSKHLQSFEIASLR